MSQMAKFWRSPWALVMLLAFGCGDDAPTPVDSGAEQDAGHDAGVVEDAGTDAGMADAGVDAGIRDAGVDSGTDAGDVDAGPCIPLTETNCPMGQWCAPEDDLLSGNCVDFGSTTAGGECAAQEECASGHICSNGSCELACNPALGDASCPSGSGCANNLGSDGRPTPLGVCIETCDFDEDPNCSGDLSCLPADVTTAAFDACFPDVPNIPEGGDCALAGIPRLGLCAPNRICYSRADLPPGLLCWDFCRESAGSLSAPDHPDCMEGERCVQFATTLGVCVRR